VTWKPCHAPEQDHELHLDESVHIEGLGTVTLLDVNPPRRSSSSEIQVPEAETIE